MNQSSWHEIKSLLWIAIEQTSQKKFQVDAKTQQFSTPNKKLATPQSKKEETIPTQEITKQTLLRPQLELKKLLPQAKELPKIDTEPTLTKIRSLKNPPKLAEKHLYPEPKIEKKKMQYAFFLAIEKEHEPFTQNVFQALHSRLQIAVHSYSCDTCAINLPLALAEYSRVIFVLDQHKKSHILHTLESLDTFSSQVQIYPNKLKNWDLDEAKASGFKRSKELSLSSKTDYSTCLGIKPPLPFTALGTLHSHPILALILHQKSHEDPKFKGQLWNALQELAKG